MLGLTLWRPWDHAFVRGNKDVENRPWPPWSRAIGQLVALHAGLKYDTEGAAWMVKQKLHTPPDPMQSTLTAGHIVGVARIAGYYKMPTSPRVVAKLDFSISPWAFGPYVWRMADVAPLSEPVKCRGAQGLWEVPADVERLVLERVDVDATPPEPPQGELFG